MQASIPGTSIAIATPDLEIIDGQITTTSQQIAEHFGKRHADVIRAIRKLEAPTEFTERNFALSEFTDSTGRTLPAYRITRDGFTLLAMGFTGKEALQWKVAYLTAFNKMEAQLLAQAAQPQQMRLDYDRISPAQKQDLKEIVDAIVKAGVQTYAETWARLQKKFRVNSYLELPATQHLEARAYLIEKLPKDGAGDVVDETPPSKPSLDDAVRLDHAFHLAAQAAAQVQRAVFKCVMAGDADWKHSRWFLTMAAPNSPVHVHPMHHSDFISNWPRLVRDVASGECMCTSAELLDMASACMQRLQKRGGSAHVTA